MRGAPEKAWRSADAAEARQLLDAEIGELRSRTYDDGDRGNGDLRVIANIDDGGETASWPIAGSFILRRDGAFVGE